MIKELLGDNILIKPIFEDNITSGGIIIPDSAQNIKNTSKGIVMDASKGYYNEQTGEFKKTTVKKGEKVIYNSACRIMKHSDWEGLYLIEEKEIITRI